MQINVTIPDGLKDTFFKIMEKGVNHLLEQGTQDQKDSACLVQDIIEESARLAVRCDNLMVEQGWGKIPVLTEVKWPTEDGDDAVRFGDSLWLIERAKCFKLAHSPLVPDKAEYASLKNAMRAIHQELFPQDK